MNPLPLLPNHEPSGDHTLCEAIQAALRNGCSQTSTGLDLAEWLAEVAAHGDQAGYDYTSDPRGHFICSPWHSSGPARCVRSVWRVSP